jgi:hypothetical protein
MQSALLRIEGSTRSCRREEQAPRHGKLREITIGAVRAVAGSRPVVRNPDETRTTDNHQTAQAPTLA